MLTRDIKCVCGKMMTQRCIAEVAKPYDLCVTCSACHMRHGVSYKHTWFMCCDQCSIIVCSNCCGLYPTFVAVGMGPGVVPFYPTPQTKVWVPEYLCLDNDGKVCVMPPDLMR
jgi:hypothetical protein